MNFLRLYSRKLFWTEFLSLVIGSAIIVSIFVLLREKVGLTLVWSLALSGAALLFTSALVAAALTSQATEAVTAVWQAIWHVSPDKDSVAAPDLKKIRIGRELVSSLVREIYDLASTGAAVGSLTNAGGLVKQKMTKPVIPTFDDVPVPIIILNKNKEIIVANKAAGQYTAQPAATMIGRPGFEVLNLSFSNDQPLEQWLDTAGKTKATDVKTWPHVLLKSADNTQKQCDIVAAYSHDNPYEHETVLVLFENTSYNQQDASMSFVAMAVHELRTPLTMLRGYIEVFEDELGPDLNPEMQEFMKKMRFAAQSLTAFVSNILNVARVDENQLTLNLHETDWGQLLTEIVGELKLRADVRHKRIELEIAPGLPTVAADKISAYEVISNLIDNAIKYSGHSDKISVRTTLAKDGTVETVVQDYGIGMAPNILPKLFTKYYRAHPNSASAGGSGLGLYLVKAVVTAHGGRVWVNSTEGQGSSFGFSLQPYSQVSDAQKAGSNGIERQAYGWIKNHNVYR